MHHLKLILCLLSFFPAMGLAAEEPQCEPACDANTVCQIIDETNCVSISDGSEEDCGSET
jgi:hypothetical protein